MLDISLSLESVAAKVGAAAAAFSGPQLTTANGTSKNANVTVTGSPALTFAGATSNNAFKGVRADAGATGSPAKYAFEVTVNTLDTGWTYVGVDDSTTDFSLTGNGPGWNNAAGFGVLISSAGACFIVNNSGSALSIGGALVAGDKLHIERFNNAAGLLAVWQKHAGSWTSLGSKALGVLTNEKAYGGADKLGSLTFNFGPLDMTPSVGYVSYNGS